MITTWSPTAVLLFGWEAPEAIGRRMIELTVPEDQREALALNHAEHMRREGALRGRRFEVVKVDRNGMRFLAEVVVEPVTDGGETMLHAFIADIGRDGTRTADERLAAMVRSTPDALVAIDAQDVVTEWNPAAERLSGWPRAAAVGQSLDFVDPDRFARLAGTVREELERTGTVVAHPAVLLRRDGTLVVVEVSAARMGAGPLAPVTVSLRWTDRDSRWSAAPVS